VYELFVVYQFQ